MDIHYHWWFDDDDDDDDDDDYDAMFLLAWRSDGWSFGNCLDRSKFMSHYWVVGQNVAEDSVIQDQSGWLAVVNSWSSNVPIAPYPSPTGRMGQDQLEGFSIFGSEPLGKAQWFGKLQKAAQERGWPPSPGLKVGLLGRIRSAHSIWSLKKDMRLFG